VWHSYDFQKTFHLVNQIVSKWSFFWAVNAVHLHCIIPPSAWHKAAYFSARHPAYSAIYAGQGNRKFTTVSQTINFKTPLQMLNWQK
jgi:hypothetical protein